MATALDDDVNPVRWQCLIEPALQMASLLPGLDPDVERLVSRRHEAEEQS